MFVIVNVNTAAKFPPKYTMHRNKMWHLQHSSCCLVRKWGITIETLVSRYYVRQETTNWTSNRIVIMKRKYIFEVETPPQRAICPPMRYFKSMEAVSFVYFNEEMVLFSNRATEFGGPYTHQTLCACSYFLPETQCFRSLFLASSR